MEIKKLFFIFLDVDGVLNNEDYIEECYEKNGHHAMHMNHVPFDPKCLENLMILVNKLREKYSVEIILSSTWRLHEIDYEIVNARIAEYGLSLFDRTKYMGNIRGLEIKDYLDNNKKCKNFLIIDDDPFDIVTYFKDNLVLTNFKTGFNKEALDLALSKI